MNCGSFKNNSRNSLYYRCNRECQKNRCTSPVKSPSDTNQNQSFSKSPERFLEKKPANNSK